VFNRIGSKQIAGKVTATRLVAVRLTDLFLKKRLDGAMSRLALGKRGDDLPPKFDEKERQAYQWLYDRQIDWWSVDLQDKTVTTLNDSKWSSLLTFARHHGWNGIFG